MIRCWRGFLSGVRWKRFVDATATPSSLVPWKPRMFCRSGTSLSHPGCPGKEAVKRVMCCTTVWTRDPRDAVYYMICWWITHTHGVLVWEALSAIAIFYSATCIVLYTHRSTIWSTTALQACDAPCHLHEYACDMFVCARACAARLCRLIRIFRRRGIYVRYVFTALTNSTDAAKWSRGGN